jgi:hypothetical protein
LRNGALFLSEDQEDQVAESMSLPKPNRVGSVGWIWKSGAASGGGRKTPGSPVIDGYGRGII